MKNVVQSRLGFTLIELLVVLMSVQTMGVPIGLSLNLNQDMISSMETQHMMIRIIARHAGENFGVEPISMMSKELLFARG